MITKAILDNMPKGPYRVEVNPKSGFLYLVDGTGRKIGTLWGKNVERKALADFIVAAEQHKNLLSKTE